MEVYQKYQKMRKLYDKIQAAKNDIFQWFSLLKEADDEEFLCQNVEYRLGGDLHNFELWILYFEYLKEQNPKEMLHLYSKYCRFFIDDSEVKEKYQKEVEKFGPIFVAWKNPFEFETHESPPIIEGGKKKDELPKYEYEELFSSHQPPKNLPKNVFDTFLPQEFSIPRPFIRYILELADHILLRRLFNSCKYFYAKKLTPICYKFELTEYPIDADFYKASFKILKFPDSDSRFCKIEQG
uniref:F-box domain-containing protein n=1 Tax=Panagrolaimus davidi TaxID=227884 RepID=A0A914PXT4_9BILA